MRVIAHASKAALASGILRLRAIERLAVVITEARLAGVANPTTMNPGLWRRYIRAQVAAGVAIAHSLALSERYSRWHRAYMRAKTRACDVGDFDGHPD